ncbi:MAG: transcription antiterminator [Erysipelotrichaceae bacterium]|nr:transcription antiterminator [Erysipelotrichaceae bacterium]
MEKLKMIINAYKGNKKIMSAKELSLVTGFSEKVVRNEISNMLSNPSIKIKPIQSTNKGYELLLDKQEVKNFFKQQENKANILDYDSRKTYIINRLLLEKEYIKLVDLADELYVSQATINRDFREVKEYLIKHNLTVSVKPAHGISVEGDEVSKRLCFVHNNSHLLSSDLKSLTQICDLEPEDYYIIDYILHKNFITYDFYVTEVGHKNLIIHIMYMISRIKKGDYIDSVEVEYEISEVELKIAREIIENIERKYEVTIPENEVDYISLHLLGKRAGHEDLGLKISESTEHLIHKINLKIWEHLELDFRQDFDLFYGLALHIEPMITRIKYGMSLPNPLLKEVKLKFALAFECAVIASKVIYETYKKRISDEELGYLAIHYNLAIEKNEKKGNEKKFLLICSSGFGTAMLLQRKIKNEFNVGNENIKFASIKELLEIDLSKYDYLISTVTIPFEINQKVIYIENIMSDINIGDMTLVSNKKLYKYLNKQTFFTENLGETKEIVLKNICKKLNDFDIADKNLLEEILKRESLSTTEIGNMVAIPHPFSLYVKKTVLVISILKRPITWQNKKVRYVFLMLFSKEDLGIQHELNEELIEYVTDSKWLLKLDEIQSFEKLLSLFKGEK